MFCSFHIIWLVLARNNPITSPTAIIPGVFVGLFMGGKLLSSGVVPDKVDYQTYETPFGRKLLSAGSLSGLPLFFNYYDLVGTILCFLYHSRFKKICHKKSKVYAFLY